MLPKSSPGTDKSRAFLADLSAREKRSIGFKKKIIRSAKLQVWHSGLFGNFSEARKPEAFAKLQVWHSGVTDIFLKSIGYFHLLKFRNRLDRYL
ncbi:hypothetical protein [Desulfonema magnum]|uniref:hypothetical protein n=1 Tax=Desulfonema magnum TaxID=45655 RepID=UPI001A9B50DC|nr:hypothetical protein [Desulfonema magnum]